MNLKQIAIASLDGAFLMLARIGQASRRKEQATAILMAWLSFFAMGIWSFIDQWVYGVDALYLEWWPYRSKNFRSPLSTYFALGAAFLILALRVAYLTCKRCSDRIDYRDTTAREWIYFFFMGFIVVFGTTFAGNRYGSIVVVGAHLAGFCFVSKHEKRKPSA
jgi:hypothetical protein